MGRIDTAAENVRRLYGGAESPLSATDPEFAAIKERLVYGEVYAHVKLPAVLREQIIIAVAAVNGTGEEAEAHALAALAAGAGLGRASAALRAVNRALASRGLCEPYTGGAETGEDDRLEKGIAAQKRIFGEGIDAMRAAASEDTRHIQDILSAWCFGDFYTRGGMALEQRELLTFCVLCALGGCEPQLRSHISGNLAVGNGRGVLLDALTVCLPYIGFPRTLNALNLINELAK